MNEGTNAHRRRLVHSLAAVGALVFALGPTTAAFAHEGEENVPAITDVQEAIAILAEHPGLFPAEEVTDHAMDKVGDALESNDSRGVVLENVSQAKDALDAGKTEDALTLLERSIGACPGAPVIEPEDAPRTPPPLSSPCPSLAHIQGLDRSPVGGAQEPVLIALGAVLILAGLGLARRIR
jgi:hypothetical protein